MPCIVIIKDIFTPDIRDEVKKNGELVAEGTTILQHLQGKFPGFIEFAEVTVCHLSNHTTEEKRELMRSEWATHKLRKDDVVAFVTHPGTSLVIAIIVSLIVAIAFYLFMDVPIASDEGVNEASPVYNYTGQSNEMKPGQAVEKHYGHPRVWPSYAARPYNRFVDQDQYLYALLCVGLGDYEITEIRVDDTPIAQLQDTVVEIYAPGEEVTLFETNVLTSAEVNGIEMVGPNEPDYEWSGWYTINEPGTKCYKIGFDFAFRQGLFRVNDKGKKKGVSVTSEFQYQEVDDDGNPVGDPMALMTFNKSMASDQAQRFTVEPPVTPARYRVRGRRTSNASGDYKTRDQFHWEGLRAYCEQKQNFGNVTLLAFKAKATNNLNDNSKSRINIKVQTWTDVWNEEANAWVPTLTRSPVWAMCDMLRAEYGMRLPSSFIDKEAMTEAADYLYSRGINFDWSYDSRTTVWAAIQDCLQIARAKPIIPNGIFSIAIDRPATEAAIGFNSTNIIRGSFSASTNFADFGEHDGIEVEYINPLDWKKETVLCLLGEDQGINPQTVRLPGCTNRDIAYRWGLYTRATQIYQPDNIELETGMEAGTASYGTVAAVQHDLLPVEWDVNPNNSGILKHNAMANEGGFTFITLPKTPVWEYDEDDELLTHRISLRDKSGTIQGPYICTPVEGIPRVIKLNVELILASFTVNEYSEPARFWFGVSGKEMIWHKIVKIMPTGRDAARLTLVPYREEVYQYDDEVAPPIDLPGIQPGIPTAPIVTGLDVNRVPDDLAQVLASWIPALGANNYRVEISTDGETYTFFTETTFSSIRIDLPDEEYMWVRVCGVGLYAGPWAYWEGTVNIPDAPPNKVNGLRADGSVEGPNLSLLWDADPLAEEYHITIFVGANPLASYTTETTAFLYTGSQAQVDSVASGFALTGTLNIFVSAENALDEGPNSDILTVVNANPTGATRNATSVIAGSPTGYRTISVGFTHTNSDLLKVEMYVALNDAGFSGVLDTNYFFCGDSTGGRINAVFPTGWATAFVRFRVYDQWHSTYIESASQKIYPSWP